jgi:hypothetical protein
MCAPFFAGYVPAMKQICLTRGLVALVDDCDFESLSKFKWHVLDNGHTYYAVRKQHVDEYVDGKRATVLMHRQVLNLPVGDLLVADHINHDGLDNQRANLRVCTQSKNMQNVHKRSCSTSSQFKGVYWSTPRQHWVARIHVSKACLYLGSFTSEIEAAKAYDIAALKHFGEVVSTNFPK